MNNFSILILTASLSMSTGKCGDELNPRRLARVVTSFYLNSKYEIAVGEKQLLLTPKWLSTDDNPPLSARRAVLVARAAVETLVVGARDWRVLSVTIEPTCIEDCWIYVVAFDPTPPDAQDKLWVPFKIV